MNWYQAAAYANAASSAAGLDECYTCTGSGISVECEVALNPYECNGHRLLTEAEWEGAARCGTDLDYAGSDVSTDVAWTAENANGSTHTVAGLAPNACGIYDMSGNVFELTQDWHADYGADAATDPLGPSSGTDRVRRGGGYYWSTPAPVSYRFRRAPADAEGGDGFRLARTVVP